MNIRMMVSLSFIIISLVLGIFFFLQIDFPVGLADYFEPSYYQQYAPLAISVELFIAGLYLLMRNNKANFTLALFGFTALLDPLFNLTGLFTSLVPLYATIIFVLCGIAALWIAFTNSFGTGKISPVSAIISFILGTAFELVFNYLFV